MTMLFCFVLTNVSWNLQSRLKSLGFYNPYKQLKLVELEH